MTVRLDVDYKKISLRMNEENINKSFDNLFDNDGSGWIITKNEKGKVKLAPCAQDETNIYEKTRDWKIKDVDETKTDSFRLPQNELYKTARFFIRDLLNSEKQDKHFICNKVAYINAFICGTIVSFYERYGKYSIIVDDGTSSIKCIIDKETLDLSEENGSSFNDDDLNRFFKQNEKSVFFQATILTRRSTKYLKNLVPSIEDLELGNIVKIFGTLSEYNCNRYLFIKKIIKESKETISHVTYLEDMLQIYSKAYTNL